MKAIAIKNKINLKGSTKKNNPLTIAPTMIKTPDIMIGGMNFISENGDRNNSPTA